MLLSSGSTLNNGALPPLPRKLTAGRSSVDRIRLIMDSDSEEDEEGKNYNISDNESTSDDNEPNTEDTSDQEEDNVFLDKSKGSFKDSYFKLRTPLQSYTPQNYNITRLENETRFKNIWESIIEKYSKYDEDDQGDLIDLSNLKIESNNGHVERLKNNERNNIWKDEVIVNNMKSQSFSKCKYYKDPVSYIEKPVLQKEKLFTTENVPQISITDDPINLLTPSRMASRTVSRRPSRLPTRSNSPTRNSPLTSKRKPILLSESSLLAVESDSLLLLSPLPPLTPKPTPRSFSNQRLYTKPLSSIATPIGARLTPKRTPRTLNKVQDPLLLLTPSSLKRKKTAIPPTSSEYKRPTTTFDGFKKPYDPPSSPLRSSKSKSTLTMSSINEDYKLPTYITPMLTRKPSPQKNPNSISKSNLSNVHTRDRLEVIEISDDEEENELTRDPLNLLSRPGSPTRRYLRY